MLFPKLYLIFSCNSSILYKVSLEKIGVKNERYYNYWSRWIWKRSAMAD